MTHKPGLTAMKTMVYDILRQQGLVETFNSATDFHLRLENPPYMPLVIERHSQEVSIAHYFTQNGDAMRDPELTFSLPFWSPTSITQDPLAHYASVDDLPVGSQRFARLVADLLSFARTWAGNLQAQGFAGQQVKASSLTHQSELDKVTQSIATVVGSPEPSPDDHLEMCYEDQSVCEYEPSPYDGTYSEE